VAFTSLGGRYGRLCRAVVAIRHGWYVWFPKEPADAGSHVSSDGRDDVLVPRGHGGVGPSHDRHHCAVRDLQQQQNGGGRVPGTCWLVTANDGRTVGTITVESQADPYWLPSDDPDNALYIHRMVVDNGARGSELGSALLDWAARRARQAGRSWLRLDAWKSNPALHKYYLDRGFSLVRIDDNPSDPSGACFQRPASVELHLGPDVSEDGAA
jgi:GNAT superfamily N-acetyltransferase